MDFSAADVSGLAAALGIGLLIGIERERRKGQGSVRSAAGIRTHALLSLAGALSVLVDSRLLVVTGLLVAGLVVVSYARSREDDPGVTGEVAMAVSFLLGALAMRNPALASGLGVIVAVLLHTKRPLHRLSRELISQRELGDLLLLAAAILVIWPLLPDRSLDPWGALNPRVVWKYVVLVMAVGAAGHVALRLVGARWGLPLAGFFSGFASSTAATAGFGQRARETPAVRRPAASAALLSNLASLLLFVAVVGAGSPALLRSTAWALAAAVVVLLATGAAGVWGATTDQRPLPGDPTARAFRLSWALTFGAAITVVLFVSAWLRDLFGDAGALVTAGIAALAELHAAAATVAQLSATGGLGVERARWGVLGLLVASGVVKSVVALTSGGRRYGLLVTAGLLGSVAAAAVVLVLTPA
jgi:uncharacterized membrane protein (DUF4010 family)